VRRGILIAIALATAVLLQTTIFADLRLLGARPELMFLLAILVGFYEGPAAGTTVGFFGGMAQDFLIDQPKGMTALALTLLGVAVGSLRTYIVSRSALVPVFVVFIGTFVGQIFYGLVAFLLGQFHLSPLYLLQVAALSGLYNAILTPLAAPVVRRILDVTRTPTAGRW
jgi:rod shape-determining protein MreD